ncbi:PilZ domain-containing protein [Methylobacterium sp. J-076]|uniref:PilZ domain-containing protein n=1 Tax=Methylobacterium sp. J-076 TaxID=2836655 RepID=UPI001FBBD290|nr:PilZ domain-containing protein [Methylobacterium sp. J-076]MCJ2013265.1 PilZ domain-containing protein [Methylobacterium sp. J-076]
MPERQGRRVPLDRPGRVYAGEGTRHPCIVRDISAAGARLLLPEAGEVPETFALSLDPGGDRWACRVVWRRLGEVGVAFN